MLNREAGFAIIGVLVVSSALSLYKAVGDEKDKRLLQTLSITGLELPAPAYDNLYKELSGPLKARGYPDEPDCYHTQEGMACFMRKTPPKKPPVAIVLNRFELAQMYANQLRSINNWTDVSLILDEIDDPKQKTDAFEDKLGILGQLVVYDMCGTFPDSHYGDRNGLR